MIILDGKTALFAAAILALSLSYSTYSRGDETTMTTTTTAKTAATKSFLDTFPNLKQYVFQEPKSGFYLGMGISPLGVGADRFSIAADFFQVHYLSDKLDFEILDASYGLTVAQSSEFESTAFIFRTSPKYRISNTLSLGPLLGMEYISFPKVGSRITNPLTNRATKDQPFSSHGLIYGGMVTETFPYKTDYLIQINAMAYQETYSTTRTQQNWVYLYDDSRIAADHNLIGANLVYMLSLSFLY